MSLGNKIPFFNSNVFVPSTEIANLKKFVDEIDLNLKINFNSLIINSSELKDILDSYLNQIQESDQKLNFLLKAEKDKKQKEEQILPIKIKLDQLKNQVALLLRMYELKSRIPTKK